MENKWSLQKEELARGGSVTIDGSLSSWDTVILAGHLLSQKKPGKTGSKAGRGFTCIPFCEKIYFNILITKVTEGPGQRKILNTDDGICVGEQKKLLVCFGCQWNFCLLLFVII